MTKKIFYTKPSITEKEVLLATDAATNGWGENCYKYIERFESLFKEYTGAHYAIATSSCTGALHMGLAALGIGHGDEIIIADTNWIASAAPITYLGATPVFVDVLEDTWCINPKKIEEQITPKTKAIIAVHLYGNLCEMDQLLAIGSKYNIPIIEDSAEGIGSYWHGKHTGTIGTFGTFSFHGTKTITTGEGGMFVTNDEALYEKVLTLSNHGRSSKQTKQFWPDAIGFKYKLSNIQAAIGCAQMERIDDLVNNKREVFLYYSGELQNLSISMNPEKPFCQNGYWMPTVIFNDLNFNRDILLAAFKESQIDARVFFWPLSMLPMFDEAPENRVAYSLCNRGINLPSYYDITTDEMDRVVKIFKENIN